MSSKFKETLDAARDMGFDIPDKNGNTEADLLKAQELLKDLTEKVKADPGVLYDPDIFEAIRDVYNNNPSEWLRVKKILKQERISSRDLVKELKESEDEDELPIESPFVELDNGVLAEMVVQDGIAKFAIYDPTSQQVTYVRELEKDGVKIIPPFRDEIFLKGYVTLPSMPLEYVDETRLYEELRAFVHRYLEVSEDYESIACFYPMLTWVYDVMNVIAYLRAKGDWGVGKSRFLDVFKAICYRSIATTGAMSEAPIFRIMDKWKGAMIMDEGDLGKSRESAAAMEKILVCGFERGKPIIRCNPNNPVEVNVFDPFGPKIIATRYAFKDKALESRCFTDVMKEARRTDIPIELPPTFYDEALLLRNKLLMYRFRNRAKIKARSDAGEIELDVKGLPKRIQQAARPISVILADRLDLLAELKIFMESKAKSMVAEASETLEGYIVRVLADPEPGVEGDTLIWNSDFGDLVELIKSASGNYKLTVNMIRSRANSLGLKTKKGQIGKERKRLVTCELSVFENLKKRYIPYADDADDADDIQGPAIKKGVQSKEDKSSATRISSSEGIVDRPDRPDRPEESGLKADLQRGLSVEDVVNRIDQTQSEIYTPALKDWLDSRGLSYVATTCQLQELGWKFDLASRTMSKSPRP